MSDPIIVYKGRTMRIPISLGIDVSEDTITSQIKSDAGAVIATWTVENESDGTDGEIILNMDNSITAAITATTGKMDLKRVLSNGEPVHVFDALEVVFKETITS